MIVGYQVYNPAAFVKGNTFSTQQEKNYVVLKSLTFTKIIHVSKKLIVG
jgi:hypothetical protein